MRPGCAVLAICALIALAPLSCRAGEPALQRFALVDREPFSAILGIPDGWTDAGGPRAELSWDIANNATAQQSGDEGLKLDGETHTVTLRLQHRYGARLSASVEVPWIAHNGGFLDRPIDSWHDTFGLNAGIRPTLPTGDLQFVYSRGGAEQVRLDNATSGIGDVRTSAALRLTGGSTASPLAWTCWPTSSGQRATPIA